MSTDRSTLAAQQVIAHESPPLPTPMTVSLNAVLPTGPPVFVFPSGPEKKPERDIRAMEPAEAAQSPRISPKPAWPTPLLLGKEPAALWAHALTRVDTSPDGCWLWLGALNSKGYAIMSSGRAGRLVLVHRLAVIHRDRHLPPDLTVDHACHDSLSCAPDTCNHRRCINPAHLRVMSNGDNSRRRNPWNTCTQGHPLTSMPDGRRRCTTCARNYADGLWRPRPRPAFVDPGWPTLFDANATG